MKVLHFILGRADPNTSNGVNKVIIGHAKYGILQGEDVSVVGLSSSQTTEYELIERDGFNVHSYSSFWKGAFEKIKELSKEVDIVHLHSVWNNYNLVVAKYLNNRRVPYVVTVHSGLTEDRLKQSNYHFKTLYHKFLQKRMFDTAAGIHALTNEEATVLRKYTDNKNIFVVENGLEPIQFNKNKRFCSKKDKYKIGFLGRLAVEKNIKGLLLALSVLPADIKKKINLVLIGPVSKTDRSIFNDIISNHNLSEMVIFTGSLYKNDKIKALSSLDCYIHPAFSDVVSIAVMEAMSFGLPSIITRTSDVGYYYDTGSFIMVEPDYNSIAKGLIQFIEYPEHHQTMSDNARSLAFNVFNWEVVIPKLYNEYSKLVIGR